MNHSVNIYKIKLSDIKSTPEVFKAIDCDTDVDILEHTLLSPYICKYCILLRNGSPLNDNVD